MAIMVQIELRKKNLIIDFVLKLKIVITVGNILNFLGVSGAFQGDLF